MKLEDTLEQYKKLHCSISQASELTHQLDAIRASLLTPQKFLAFPPSSQILNAVNHLNKSTMALTSLRAQTSFSTVINEATSNLTVFTQSTDKLNSVFSAQSQTLLCTAAFSLGVKRYNAIIQAFSKAVTASEPYIPPEEVHQVENVIPAVQQKKHRLSISDVLALISILVTIYTSIISSRPNDQLDRIITQNDIIISQQEELIPLKQEDLKLMEVLNTLCDSINLLTDEVELLQEELERSNNLSDCGELPDLNDSQQKGTDSQE